MLLMLVAWARWTHKTKSSISKVKLDFGKERERKKPYLCAGDVMTPKGLHVSPIANQQFQVFNPRIFFVLQSFYGMNVNNPRRTNSCWRKFMFYAFEFWKFPLRNYYLRVWKWSFLFLVNDKCRRNVFQPTQSFFPSSCRISGSLLMAITF